MASEWLDHKDYHDDQLYSEDANASFFKKRGHPLVSNHVREVKLLDFQTTAKFGQACSAIQPKDSSIEGPPILELTISALTDNGVAPEGDEKLYWKNGLGRWIIERIEIESDGHEKFQMRPFSAWLHDELTMDEEDHPDDNEILFYGANQEAELIAASAGEITLRIPLQTWWSGSPEDFFSWWSVADRRIRWKVYIRSLADLVVYSDFAGAVTPLATIDNIQIRRTVYHVSKEQSQHFAATEYSQLYKYYEYDLDNDVSVTASTHTHTLNFQGPISEIYVMFKDADDRGDQPHDKNSYTKFLPNILTSDGIDVIINGRYRYRNIPLYELEEGNWKQFHLHAPSAHIYCINMNALVPDAKFPTGTHNFAGTLTAKLVFHLDPDVTGLVESGELSADVVGAAWNYLTIKDNDLHPAWSQAQ